MAAYQMVFCDVDGTLHTPGHTLLDDTKAAVRALKEKGVPFIVSSGRTPRALYPVVRGLGIETPVIASNGGYVGEISGKTLFETGFDLPAALEIRQAASAFVPDAVCTTYCGTLWIADDAENPFVKYERSIVGIEPVVGKLEDLAGPSDSVQKLLYIGPFDLLPGLCGHLKERFPEYEIFISNERFLEILPPGISKATGARFLCGKFGIAPEKTIAFGDGPNDTDLFGFAGMSVAMGNAPDAVKQKARHVTSSNRENGIARVLNDVFDLGLSLGKSGK